MHLRMGAVCALVLIVTLQVPFHRKHPIIQSPNLQLTPTSFAQLGTDDENGALAPSVGPEPKGETPSEEQ